MTSKSYNWINEINKIISYWMRFKLLQQLIYHILNCNIYETFYDY